MSVSFECEKERLSSNGVFCLPFSTYLFIAPKVVRPGYDLTIHGSLLVVPPSPVTVTVELYDENPSGEERRRPRIDPPVFIEQRRMEPEPVLDIAMVEPPAIDIQGPVDALPVAPAETTTPVVTTTTERPLPKPIALVQEVFTDDKGT